MKYKLFFTLFIILGVSIIFYKTDKFISYFTQFQVFLIQSTNDDKYSKNTIKFNDLKVNKLIKENFNKNYFIVDAWGDKGMGDDQFIQPYGTMVNGENFFVSDCRKGKIMVFNTNTKKLVKTYGYGWGKQPGYLDYPADITVNKILISNRDNLRYKSDRLYVVEEKTNRISVFNLESGEFLYEYGEKGSGKGEFINPLGIEIDYNNNIYVVDYGNNRIQKFDKNFNFLKEFGSFGDQPGQFNGPYYMTIDYDNNLYIVDRGNDRIQVFDDQGNFKFLFGEKGSENGKLDYPHEITFKNNKLFVADFNNHRIQIFDKKGNFINYLGEDYNLAGPKTVAVNDQNEILITDLYASFKYVTKWSTDYKSKIDDYAFYKNSSQFFFPQNLVELDNYPFSSNKDFYELNYTPDYPFFSNYLVKERKVYVPKGYKIDLVNQIFPENTVIEKNFIQNTDCKIVESRYMIFKNQKWNYATYINDNNNFKINLTPKNISAIDKDKGAFKYYVPGLNNCYDCHKNNNSETLGFNKASLNNDFNYLKNYIITRKYDKKNFSDLTMELKSNCAYCHNDITVFSHYENEFSKNINRISPVGNDTLIYPLKPKKSKIYNVINDKQMPPYGVAFKNRDLLVALENYINSL